MSSDRLEAATVLRRILHALEATGTAQDCRVRQAVAEAARSLTEPQRGPQSRTGA